MFDGLSISSVVCSLLMSAMQEASMVVLPDCFGAGVGGCVGSEEGGGGDGGGTAVSASTFIMVGVMGMVVSFLSGVVGDWLVGK